MVSIKINGKTEEIKDNPSVLSAVETMKIDQNGIAVAVNQNIISKENWATTSLKDNDEILIIKATQGG